MDKEKSEVFYCMKGIAIFCVVCAHIQIISSDYSLSRYIQNVFNNLGSIGVGVFYVISGYFFHITNNSGIRYLFKKRQLLFPWIIVGTMVWFYIVLRKGNLNLTSLLLFLIGYNSYLYFLTDLMLFYVLFFLISRIKYRLGLCLACVITQEIFICLESQGVSCFPTPYLNPFIFIGYFAIGYYIQVSGIENDLIKKITSRIWLVASAIPFFSIALAYYKNAFSFLIEVILIVAIYNWSILINGKTRDALIYLGKQSLSIYLFHMPFAGITAWVFNRFFILHYFDVLRPFIVIFVTVILISLISAIAVQMNRKSVLKFLGIAI